MLYKGDTLYLDWLEDGIAELVFDAPGSVNKLDTATVASLGHALDVLEKQSDLKGLLLRSEKAAFIVGADITEFLSLFLVPEEQLSQWLHFANSVFNRLEDLPVPTISAVNGYALGGGCECVLATDYRLATPDLRIGLPETKLGIMPGFGGSVRLPRLLGADSALEIIAAGKDVGADQALKIGLVDGVVAAEKLRDGALAILRQAMNGDLDWKAKRQPKLEPLKLSKIEASRLPKAWSRKPPGSITRRRSPRSKPLKPPRVLVVKKPWCWKIKALSRWPIPMRPARWLVSS